MAALWLASPGPAAGQETRSAGPDYLSAQLIVKFREALPGSAEAAAQSDARAGLEQKIGVRQIEPFIKKSRSSGSLGQNTDLASGPLARIYRIYFTGPYSVAQAQRLYQELPQVEYAVPNYRRTIQVTPNDPNFTKQWGLNNTGQIYRNSTRGTAGADIKAPGAWDYQNAATGFIVAVIDTGVDFGHPDLAGNLTHNSGEIPDNGLDDDGNGYIDDYNGWDFVNSDKNPQDDHGHGTAVSGVIGARGNNGVGVCGLAWQAKLIPVKVLDSSGSGSSWDIMGGVTYAAELGAKVLNMSLGGPFGSTYEQEVITEAYGRGALITAAMGNSGDSTVLYPAGYDHVLAVGATTSSDTRWSGSCYGSHIAVTAPGEDIYTTALGGGYTYYTGTSLATPYVSGLAALVLAANPGFTSDQISQRIKETAHDLGASGWDQYYGFGRIDARQAIHPAPGTPIINSITAASTQATYFKSDALVTTGGTVYFNSLAGQGAAQTVTLEVSWVADTYDKLIGSAAFGQPQQEDTSGAGGWKVSYPVPTACGSQTVNLIVQDTDGRRSTATIEFVEDNEAPTFDLLVNGLRPLTGDFIPPLPPLAAHFADASGLNGAASEFYVDGVLKEDGTDSSHRFDTYDPAGFQLNYGVKTALADGLHGIGCRLTDNVGNISELFELTGLQVASTFAIKNVCNFPNPLIESGSFSYQLSEDAAVDLRVYSAQGRLVYARSFAAGSEGGRSGFNKIAWSGRDNGGNNLPNGVYFCLVKASGASGSQTAKTKIAILR